SRSFHPQLFQFFFDNLTFLPWNTLRTESHRFFSPFPSDKNDIPYFSYREGLMNGASPVEYPEIILIPFLVYSLFNIVYDTLSLFIERILVRQDDHIGISGCYFSHERSFSFIALSAGSEYMDDFTARDFQRQNRGIEFFESVRRDRIIDENIHSCFIGNKLHPPRHSRHALQCRFSRRKIDRKQLRHPQSGKSVLYIEKSGHLEMESRPIDGKPGPFEVQRDVFRKKMRHMIFHAVENGMLFIRYEIIRLDHIR